MVEFRLLGQFGMWDGRVEIALGPARQRCVLAVLLMSHGQPLPAEALISRVWSDQPPQRALEVLYTYLSRLRRLLPGDAARLVRRNGGYLCDTEPELIDVFRFQRLLSSTGNRSEPPARLDQLRQALALWQGEPLAGLTGDWAAATRERLHRQWLSAMIMRNDLELRLGHHATLVVELSDMVSQYPTTEPLAGQLMLALHRSGRHGEALEVFRRTRSALVEQHGLEPGPELRRLEYAILTNDSSLDPPAPVIEVPRSASPHQLPRDVSRFAGRAQELATLDSHPANLIVITGMAGIGKTTLAVHWAHRVADQYPDGQLYVNLRGFSGSGSAMSPSAAIGGFLEALGVAPQRIPTEVEARAAMYRSTLAGRKVLIVLDNARDEEHVRHLLPGTPGCLTVITSRNRLPGLVSGEGAQPVTLDVLGHADAHTLMTRRLGHDRVAAEPQAVGEIVDRCGGLPLALAIVAAQAAERPRLPLSVLAGQLDSASGTLDGFSEEAGELRALFSWSYRTLSPPAARLFRLLGLHPGPDISATAAGSIAGLPLPETGKLLRELVRSSFIDESVPDRYVLHDLLRAYATELATDHDSEADRYAAQVRVFDHYLHSAFAAARLHSPHRQYFALAQPSAGVAVVELPDREHAVRWFAAELRVLLEILKRTVQIGSDAHTWQLAWAVFGYFNLHGHWQETIIIQQAGMAAAQRLGDLNAQARISANIASGLARFGRYGEAEAPLIRALDLYLHLEDRLGQANIHLDLSAIHGQLTGGLPQALHHAGRALELYQSIGDHIGQGRALNSVGWFHTLLGRPREGLDYCQRGLAILQERGHRHSEGLTWDSIGRAHYDLGDYVQAAICYEHSIATYQSLGARFNEAETRINLGDTHLAAGNPDAARDQWQRALPILDDLGHPLAGEARQRIGTMEE